MYAHEERQLDIILYPISFLVQVAKTFQFFVVNRLLLSFSIIFVVEEKNISGSVLPVTYDMTPRGKQPQTFCWLEKWIGSVVLQKGNPKISFSLNLICFYKQETNYIPGSTDLAVAFKSPKPVLSQMMY